MAAMNMNEQLFREMMAQGKTFLVDFWAPWCTYCRRISAAYDKVAQEQEGRLTVVKINIDEEPGAAAQAQIQVIPTLILYKDGKAAGSIVAPGSKAVIDSFIQENLASG